MDDFYTSSEAERRQLRSDCFALIDRISKHTYSIKLLRAAKAALLLVSKYKAKPNR